MALGVAPLVSLVAPSKALETAAAARSLSLDGAVPVILIL